MTTDRLGERGHVVVMVRLLERTDDTDTGATRLTVEPDQLPAVSPTCHVLLFQFHVNQAVMLRHLLKRPGHPV